MFIKWLTQNLLTLCYDSFCKSMYQMSSSKKVCKYPQYVNTKVILVWLVCLESRGAPVVKSHMYSTCTSYVCAAIRPLLAYLCWPVKRTVHFVSTQHIAGVNWCLRQVTMGGVSATHWPFVEQKPEKIQSAYDECNGKKDFYCPKYSCITTDLYCIKGILSLLGNS